MGVHIHDKERKLILESGGVVESDIDEDEDDGMVGRRGRIRAAESRKVGGEASEGLL